MSFFKVAEDWDNAEVWWPRSQVLGAIWWTIFAFTFGLVSGVLISTITIVEAIQALAESNQILLPMANDTVGSFVASDSLGSALAGSNGFESEIDEPSSSAIQTCGEGNTARLCQK